MPTYFTEETPIRDVSANNFMNGKIKFVIKQEAEARYNPARSYFRVRGTFTGLGAANVVQSLTMLNDLAPAMFLCDGLFNQICVKCNGVPVDEQNNYCAQIGALVKRMHYSDSFLQKQGMSFNFAEPLAFNRMQQVLTPAPVPLTFDGKAQHPTSSVYEAFNGANVINTSTLAYATAGAPAVATITLVTGNFLAGQYIYEGAYIRAQIGSTNFATYQVNNVTALTFDIRPIPLAPDGVTVAPNIVAAAIPTAAAAAAVARILIYPVANRPVPDELSARAQQSFELIYVPSLPFFREDQYLPPANWEIEFTPQSNLRYQKYAVESIARDQLARLNVGAANPDPGWSFAITDMRYYTYKHVGGVLEDGQFHVSLDKVSCQAESITSASSQQKTFPIQISNHKISIAFQDSTVESNTLFSPMKFKVYGNGELNTTNHFVKKGSLTLPNPQPSDEQYALPVQNINQQYYEQMMYNGNAFDDGAHESLQRWIDRGIYFSYNFPSSREDKVQVTTQFSSIPTPAGVSATLNLLLFDHFKSDIYLSIKNGVVSDIKVI